MHRLTPGAGARCEEWRVMNRMKKNWIHLSGFPVYDVTSCELCILYWPNYEVMCPIVPVGVVHYSTMCNCYDSTRLWPIFVNKTYPVTFVTFIDLDKRSCDYRTCRGCSLFGAQSAEHRAGIKEQWGRVKWVWGEFVEHWWRDHRKRSEGEMRLWSKKLGRSEREVRVKWGTGIKSKDEMSVEWGWSKVVE